MLSEITGLKVIVFDFGGVIFPTEPWSGPVPIPEEQTQVRNALRDIAAQMPLTVEDLIKKFRERTQGVSVERLAIVLKSICEPDTSLLTLIHSFRATYAVYGLVNAPYGWTEIRRAIHHLDDIFTRVFVSHEIDIRKPDPRIFQHFLEQTGLGAEECLFVDDNVENIEAARALGFHAFLYTNEIDFEEFLGD